MVNHHKVNMKMDYMTDQTDHDSFIIIRLSLKATPAELNGEELGCLFLPVEILSCEGKICWNIYIFLSDRR